MGRQRELAAIESVLQRRAGGVASTLWIHGEAGIGKTSLLDELRARAEARGHLVVSGPGAEFERDNSFGVWIDALDDYAGSRGLSRLERLLGDRREELAWVLPAIRAPSGFALPALPEERYRAHRAVRALLDAVARQRSVVVALDDLQSGGNPFYLQELAVWRSRRRRAVPAASEDWPAETPQSVAAALAQEITALTPSARQSDFAAVRAWADRAGASALACDVPRSPPSLPPRSASRTTARATPGRPSAAGRRPARGWRGSMTSSSRGISTSRTPSASPSSSASATTTPPTIRGPAESWLARGEATLAMLELPMASSALLRARADLNLAEEDPDTAAAVALEAVAQATAAGARVQAARCRTFAGRALVAAGQLGRAEAERDACGALRLRDEAARELRRLGRRVAARQPRGSGGTGLDTLSGRERDIVAGVAQGRTNREIGEELFLSAKTVEGHLTNVFAKLGVRSRAEVAEAVGRARRED